jgi:hypothetical protein
VKPLNMLAIYEVGKWFTLLYRSHEGDGQHFQRRYNALRQRLEECSLTRSLEAVKIIGSYGQSGRRFTPDELDRLAHHCQGVDNPLQAEVGENEVLLVPKGTVTPAIQALAKLPVLMPQQPAFIKELETCIHAGGYRSAIVMGWSFLYDYVRSWVFLKKLPLLNAELAAWKRPPINAYSDFFGLSEKTFLDTVATSKQQPAQPAILGTKIVDRMKPLLTERNEYAHANYQDPTLNQANHFVEQSFAVLNTSPFV